MLGPSPRHTFLLIRFAIVALTLLAMLKFLPRAAGAESDGFAVHVTDEHDDTVTEINATRLERTRTFPVGKRFVTTHDAVRERPRDLPPRDVLGLISSSAL